MASKFVTTLRQRDMRYILGAYLIDDTASWGYTVVLAAYVYGRTGSTGWIALIACSRWLAGLLISGYAGVLADRYDRARLIATTGALCTVSMTAMTLVVGFNGPLWLIPALSVLHTALSSPVRPATGSLVPDVVPEAELIYANSLFALLENVVVVAGPAIGGLVLVVGTPTIAVGINAASYVVAASLYRRVHTRSRGDASVTGESKLAQWSAGVRSIGRSRAAILLTVFMGLAAAVYGASIVLYGPMSRQFGTGANGYSYLLGASALGSVLAAFVADRLSARSRLAPLLVTAIVLEAVPFWLSDFVHNAWAGGVLQAVSGLGIVVVDVLAITALQRDLPRATLGRALAATGAVTLGATIIGNLIATALVSGPGLGAALVVVGLGFPAIGVALLPALIAGDRTTADRAHELQPVVALIERLDLFDGASRRVVERLATSAERRVGAVGDVLMRQGDESDALWLLESGRLGIEADGVAVPDVTAPGYVGELGLIHEAPRSATVTVREPSELLRITAADFAEAVESAASSASFAAVAGERLARTSPRVVAPAGASSS